jgi:hypothetical protein
MRSRILVAGLCVLVYGSVLAQAGPAQAASEYGVESVSASESTTQAGGHPDFQFTFNLNTDPSSQELPPGVLEPFARIRSASFELPPGLIGSPGAVPKCSTSQFATFKFQGPGCPMATQVGITKLSVHGLKSVITEPIFNMETPSNGTVARLGFYSANSPFFVTIHVRSGTDYGLTATIEGPPAVPLAAATTEIWGVPAAADHDTKRLTPQEAYPELKAESPPRSSGLAPIPFMTNPTSCLGPLRLTVSTDSYQAPGAFSTKSTELPGNTGCSRLAGFSPSFSATPSNPRTASPTGLDVSLKFPQDEAPNDLATSQLRGAEVTLPPGLVISSNAADGLTACSASQVRIGEDVAAECPESSKIGTAEFDVPVLSRRLDGALYQRSPEPGHLFRIWLVTDELGVHVKLPGEIIANPVTGQVTSVFLNTPQVPLRELVLHFKSGSHGVLITPPACGRYETKYSFEPWSGNAPASGTTPMNITEGCATGGFAPTVTAGSVNPAAGAFSQFTLTLSREDGEQNFRSVSVTLPKGLLAKLKGVPVCPDAVASSGNCPAGSQVGTTTVAAGAGPTPLWIPQPGKQPTAVYLAGPYKGAPYSLVVKVPAQAGPFDLGTVVTRAGLYVDPVTAVATVKSDPLPQILEGVPIFYRKINVLVNRPEFTINPTNCSAMQVTTAVGSGSGGTATPSAPFRVSDCEALDFTPKLSLSLAGATKRSGNPALKAVLTQPPGQAGIGQISTVLPPSEFIDNAHIDNPCTRVQFAAGACPPKSVLGIAKAWTPLLDQPLEGPVYFRSNGGERELPDLVADLHGQIHIELVGFIDSVKKNKHSEVSRIRTRFMNVPDAPVSRFVLQLAGGKKGLLQNSANLCKVKNIAQVKATGQNDKTYNTEPAVANDCGKKSKKSKAKNHGKGH